VPDRAPVDRVAVIGIGDDGPAGLAPHALSLIAAAELLVGGKRHLSHFVEHQAERLVIVDNVEAVLGRLAAEVGRRRCVVLASGDPCLFGIGPLIADRLGRERVEIVPQPSAAAMAFNRLGLAWQEAQVLSAHGRPLEAVLLPARQARRLAILTDDRNTPSAVAGALLGAGWADCRAFVCEHLGGARERIVETCLSALPGQTFARLNVLVLPDASPPPRDFGRSEDDYRHARGQITKAEVRAVALAKLRLRPSGLLWDVGAGSGALAIEAAGLMPAGRVLAVERDSEQLACLRANIERFAASQVEVVEGSAPAALEALPAPDRVFVGGGGVDLAAILASCMNRLPTGGRLVANAATLESAAAAEAALQAAGWRPELVQVAISRGSRVGPGTRHQALNPVFGVTGETPT
jgi:precorrin-6Y C5,15-methyltransferase (decarboxylating)